MKYNFHRKNWYQILFNEIGKADSFNTAFWHFAVFCFNLKQGSILFLIEIGAASLVKLKTV